MLKIWRTLCIAWFFSLYVWCGAAWSAPTWYHLDSHKNAVVHVSLFLSSTCPYCHQADLFFQNLKLLATPITLQSYWINERKEDLFKFEEFLSAQKMSDFAVPSIFFCDSRWTGFRAETMGKDLLNAIYFCKERIEKEGILSNHTKMVLRQLANAHFLDAQLKTEPTVLSYLISMPLIEAFNPCAFFLMPVLVFFLLLSGVRAQSWRIGGLFILGLLSAHYLQQIYPNVFFTTSLGMRILAAAFGLLLLYFVLGRFSARIGTRNYLFYASGFFTAWFIEMYQHACLLNWSFIFEQWLYNQAYSVWRIRLYELIYQFFYVLPFALVVLLLSSFFNTGFVTKVRRRFDAFGLMFLFLIGLSFLIYPGVFSQGLFLLAFVVILIITGLIRRLR